VTEPVEKGKERRRRSARVYVNANKPLAVNVPEIAALFPPDEDDDGPDRADARKRDYSQSERRALAREGNALGNGSYPIKDAEDLHNAAILARTGHGDVEGARKLIARRAKELGVANPLDSSEKSIFNHPDPYGGDGHNAGRLSAPLTDGHAASSPGDHGVGQGRSSFIAAHHPDLRQSNTSFDDVLARLRTVNGDNANGDRDITYTPGEVALRMFDAAGQAGHYHGMGPVNPSPERQDWHQHRGSAVPPNGTHSLSDPRSHAAPQAMKASEAREMIKRHMFPSGGRG